MTGGVITGPQPVIVALGAANTDLIDKKNLADEARQNWVQSFAELRASAANQRVAVANVAGLVQTASNGDESYILSCGFGVRASGGTTPPITTAPTALRTKINGTPGRVVFSWGKVGGARLYEAQYTTDLSGATGWTSAAKMPGAATLNIDGLTGGTKYAFRVRALGNGTPGPWSATIAQMAP